MTLRGRTAGVLCALAVALCLVTTAADAARLGVSIDLSDGDRVNLVRSACTGDAIRVSVVSVRESLDAKVHCASHVRSDREISKVRRCTDDFGKRTHWICSDSGLAIVLKYGARVVVVNPMGSDLNGAYEIGRFIIGLAERGALGSVDLGDVLSVGEFEDNSFMVSSVRNMFVVRHRAIRSWVLDEIFYCSSDLCSRRQPV